nr:hypothetical protein HK105_005931 [Polyrhizophydium stewartii]
MFGQSIKWGFQRNRTKSEGVPYLSTDAARRAVPAHAPAADDRRHGAHGADDGEERARSKRLLELCQEGNLSQARNFCIQNAFVIFQSINSPMDANNNTPLHLTVAQNDYVMTCLLLQKGADPNVANKSGVSPLVIARRMGFAKISKVLIKYGAVPPAKEEKIFKSNGSGGSGGGSGGGGAGGERRRDKKTRGAANASASSGGTTSAPLEFTILEEDIIRRDMFRDALEAKIFTVWNAAYLGFKDPLLRGITPANVDLCDELGCTALMKAAYRGNVDLVRSLAGTSGAQVDAVDTMGCTPLVWAVLMGRTAVVKILVEEFGADVQGVGVAGPNGTRILVTPLIAATYAGLADMAEYLIVHGADVNARVGPGRGRTALMVAAWTRRKALVKLLLQNGATVDPNFEAWLGKGILYLKKVTVEQNAWLGHAHAESTGLRRDHGSASATSINTLAYSNIGSPSTPHARRASLQDKFMYFSPEDSEVANEISKMLQNHAASAAGGHPGAGGGAGCAGLGSAGGTLLSGMSLLGGGDMDAASSSGGSDITMMRSQTTQLTRANVQRRRNNTYRQGLNLDKLIGNNSDMVMALAEQMPERGTELDVLWIAVFQCVVQLVMAANKNIKHHYIAISAKAIHCSSEIIRTIEVIDKVSSVTAGVKASAASSAGSGSSTAAAGGAAGGSNVSASSAGSDLSMFSQTPVRARMRELSRIISNEFPKQLMLSTRMAIGVWPPPDAVAEMIREAASLAASCRELVLLANTLGPYPILDKNLEVSFKAFEDGDTGDEAGGESRADTSLASAVDGPARPKGALNYTEYKRQNDLKLIEEMSKRYDLGARQSSQDVLTPEEKATDAEFFKTLDALLKQFVVSVAELKHVHDQHLKEEFIKATSTVHARADTLMEEINSFELLKDFPDDIKIEREDAERLEASGVKLPATEYPCLLKPFYRMAFDEVKIAARQVMAKGKIASASWPPPNSAAEMLQATIPCVLAVKKMVVLAKESATRIRQTHSEERRKRDNWRKECLQNERVKKLFQMWESQLLGDQSPMFKKPSTQLTRDELGVLEDSVEGLVFEETGGRRLIKGGRLNKLLEAATHHERNDDEFTAALIMTHHSFTTSSELLDQLFKRYEISPPYGLNQRLFELYIDKKVVQVRLRVCHVLQHWIQNHFEEDFIDYEQFILRYRDFVEKKVAIDFEQLSVTMLETLERKLGEDYRQRPIAQIAPDRVCPKPVLSARGYAGIDPLVALASDPRGFLEIDPLEMARQMTIVEFELFARVKAYECLDQIWDGHRRKENLANKGSAGGGGGSGGAGGGAAVAKRNDSGQAHSEISRLIQHTNQLSFWIATNIATQEVPKARMNVVKYFVQVALHCRELNNLTGVTTIIGALTMSPISRLHKTWKALEDKHPKLTEAYKELADLVSPKFQYANYRKALKEMQPPAIPFLGVYLTDLTFIELGNPDFLPDTHYINFDKRRKVYALIREIQRFGQVPFALVPVPQIQDFLKKLGEKKGTPVGWEETPLMTEDELYEQSLLIEPKEEESDSDED